MWIIISYFPTYLTRKIFYIQFVNIILFMSYISVFSIPFSSFQIVWHVLVLFTHPLYIMVSLWEFSDNERWCAEISLKYGDYSFLSEDHYLFKDHCTWRWLYNWNHRCKTLIIYLHKTFVAACDCATHVLPYKYLHLESNDKQCKMINSYINCRFSRVSLSLVSISLYIMVPTLFIHHLLRAQPRKYTVFINIFPLWNVYFKCIL